MNGQPKSTMDVFEVCGRAGTILKKAGFVVKNVSMKSEATYYSFPGRERRYTGLFSLRFG